MGIHQPLLFVVVFVGLHLLCTEENQLHVQGAQYYKEVFPNQRVSVTCVFLLAFVSLLRFCTYQFV